MFPLERSHSCQTIATGMPRSRNSPLERSNGTVRASTGIRTVPTDWWNGPTEQSTGMFPFRLLRRFLLWFGNFNVIHRRDFTYLFLSLGLCNLKDWKPHMFWVCNWWYFLQVPVREQRREHKLRYSATHTQVWASFAWAAERKQLYAAWLSQIPSEMP